MSQLSFFDLPHESIVNVAQVRQRSPFRYPGGKTWLVPRVFKWLLSLAAKPKEFIEPFAGGAIVGLTVAFEGLAEHVTLVELDEQVASVWNMIINDGEGEQLARQIETFHLTREAVRDLLSKAPDTEWERAFQTIVQNRVSRGGILAQGAGLVKYGENRKGIASRWYPQTLARRIRAIDRIRDRLLFVQGDGLEVIRQSKDRADIVFFIDPPYTAGQGKRAGRRLYKYSQIDHEGLFSLLETVQGEFLVTYDNDGYVQELAKRHGFEFVEVAMQNTHLSKMSELLIGRNLDWLG